MLPQMYEAKTKVEKAENVAAMTGTRQRRHSGPSFTSAAELMAAVSAGHMPPLSASDSRHDETDVSLRDYLYQYLETVYGHQWLAWNMAYRWVRNGTNNVHVLVWSLTFARRSQCARHRNHQCGRGVDETVRERDGRHPRRLLLEVHS